MGAGVLVGLLGQKGQVLVEKHQALFLSSTVILIWVCSDAHMERR